MDSVDTYWSDRAALAWQVELGATEAMLDAPLNRYEVPEKATKPAAVSRNESPPPIPIAVEVDYVAGAQSAAAAAQDLDGLRAALEGFSHCELKHGARNMVFGEGDPAARLMVIGEVPERDEDRAGLPFVGDARLLLDKMFAAIDLDVAQSTYLTCAFPWSAGLVPPTAQDMAMLKPFLERHITLVNPDVVVLMGNTACQMLMGKSGVTRHRGTFVEVMGRPALPMQHPAQLLRNPAQKKEAWADLLSLKTKLDSK